jgi:hypothetical protein
MAQYLETTQSLWLLSEQPDCDERFMWFLNKDKTRDIRRAIKPGNPVSLRDAAKIAKGANIQTYPKQ